MTPQEQERIKADAEAAIEILDDQLRPTSNDYGKRLNSLYYYKDGYIAGATAERDRAKVELKEAQDAARMFCNKHNETATQLAELVDRAQVLVDALGKISELDTPKCLDEYKTAFEYITKSIAATALEQWKGKEVKDEGK